MRIIRFERSVSYSNFLVCRSNHCNFRKEDTMYKTLLAGLVALTALSMTPLTASADTPHGAVVSHGEIRQVVDQYLAEHPELLRQAAHAPQGIYVGDSEHQQP
jgi:hypothetical protein